MKKLLVVLLGLASLNVYANGCGGEYQPATGTCRIIDSSGRQILYNVGRPQSSNNGSTVCNECKDSSASFGFFNNFFILDFPIIISFNGSGA